MKQISIEEQRIALNMMIKVLIERANKQIPGSTNEDIVERVLRMYMRKSCELSGK